MNENRFYTPNRMQTTLLPPCIDDWLPEDHLARFIAEIIEQIDLSKIYCKYRNRGPRAYDPRMLLGIIFYGYTQGIFSSRKLENATHDSVAFRFLSGNMHPDHDTIANFRKRFLSEIKECFKDVVLIANQMGLIQIGNLYLDGTKVKANASKSKAMSYKYMKKAIETLELEIQHLLDMAQTVDEEETEADLDLPTELRLREERLVKLNEARKEIERRAQERYDAELAEYEKKKADFDEKAKNKRRRGSKPKPPKDSEPEDRDQINFTDSESRIMKTSEGYQQCYNGQAAVTEDMLVVGLNLNNHGSDCGELLPTLDSVPKELGRVENVVADNGYLSESNIKGCVEREINAHVSLGREKRRSILDGKAKETKQRPRFSDVQKRLESKEGRELYRKRKFKVEPVFGIIKEAMGFRRFMLRGEVQVQGEWGLVCLAYNLKRMFNLMKGQGLGKMDIVPCKKQRLPQVFIFYGFRSLSMAFARPFAKIKTVAWPTKLLLFT